MSQLNLINILTNVVSVTFYKPDGTLLTLNNVKNIRFEDANPYRYFDIPYGPRKYFQIDTGIKVLVPITFMGYQDLINALTTLGLINFSNLSALRNTVYKVAILARCFDGAVHEFDLTNVQFETVKVTGLLEHPSEVGWTAVFHCPSWNDLYAIGKVMQ
jgi:hypothetical protein